MRRFWIAALAAFKLLPFEEGAGDGGSAGTMQLRPVAGALRWRAGMRPGSRLAFCLALVSAATPARADVAASFAGYADLRLIAPDGETSWLKGGLGKLRAGKGDDAYFATLFGQGRLRLTPEFSVVASLRAAPQQHAALDPLEAYARFAPQPSGRWAWSVKAGAFFAPFSLENSELGWTSYWTLTPSAIDSWFGDELRTIGGETTLEWDGEDGTLTVMAAGFGWNQPAGVLMADRGWTLDDQPSGLFDRPRIPDATLVLNGDTPPDRTPLFREFDRRAGWYGGASWDDARRWHAELIRYDNDANPAAHEDDYFAWHTRFWDAGLSGQFGQFTMLAQGLSGETTIAPTPGVSNTTDFDAAYVLLGWERGDWRFAGRADVFHTRTPSGAPGLSENGHALTASASWLPKDWFRLTGEVVALTSTRDERVVEGLAPRQSETQIQLSARFFLE
jgi:hypothetical protein